MFLSQIYDIESQITHLQEELKASQERLQQYQYLRERASDALALIKEIQREAANINEADHWQNAVMHALEIKPTPPQPPSPTSTDDPETEEETEQDPDQDENDEDLAESEPFDDKYSTPEELAAALENEDVDTVLMSIASVLDCAPAVEIEGKIWYFVENLPMDLSDRTIGYLPKSIIPEWKKQVAARKEALEKAEQDAKASIFPQEPPAANEYEPEVGDIVECRNNGLIGQVSYICDSPNGRMASIRLPGGTSNFHISNLRFIGKREEEASALEAPQEEAPVSEIDQLAKQCLGLRSWSQIRIFADSNPDVILRMQEIASTKAEKRVVQNLPSLVIAYINRAGDRTDLAWLPEPILSEVESLLQSHAA